jgi:pimeloyl-ACP methyl ester carboxylesterase
MSIPHPQVLIPALREGLPSYVRVFTLPGVPEAMLSWGGMRRLRENVYGGLPDEARQEYLAVFSEPGALTAALNWYRGILGSIDVVGDSFDARLEPPVLFVWGTREPWVTAERREAQRAYVRELEELELDAGHSLMQERPRAVVEATLGHIRKASLRGGRRPR